jgi:hypothetical protein
MRDGHVIPVGSKLWQQPGTRKVCDSADPRKQTFCAELPQKAPLTTRQHAAGGIVQGFEDGAKQMASHAAAAGQAVKQAAEEVAQGVPIHATTPVREATQRANVVISTIKTATVADAERVFDDTMNKIDTWMHKSREEQVGDLAHAAGETAVAAPVQAVVGAGVGKVAGAAAEAVGEVATAAKGAGKAAGKGAKVAAKVEKAAGAEAKAATQAGHVAEHATPAPAPASKPLAMQAAAPPPAAPSAGAPAAPKPVPKPRTRADEFTDAQRDKIIDKAVDPHSGKLHCLECGQQIQPYPPTWAKDKMKPQGTWMELDHKDPVRPPPGGKTGGRGVANGEPLCRGCNRNKGNKPRSSWTTRK